MTTMATNKIAFLFPGQGSQAIGMLDDFAQDPQLAAIIKQADAALADAATAGSLSELIATGPAEQLSLTINTQPAMLLAAYVAFKAWTQAGGPSAQAMAGHSLGEYTALTAAGAFALDDALRLVRIRAAAMQAAVPVGTGGMAVILGLSAAQVTEVCASAMQGHHDIVEAVNFNEPAQIVIAGHSAAVSRACDAAKAAGAKRALLLQVSAPFHSSLLKPAGDVLAATLASYIQSSKLSATQTIVVNNIDVQSPADPTQIADALVRQSYGPVRWVEVIQQLSKMGITHCIEFGPGKVLTGLCKRIDPALQAHAVFDRASLASVLAALEQSSAQGGHS